jgi:hypothetical protein
MKSPRIVKLLAALGLPALGMLSAGAADFARLGKDLTAVGAEKAGNKDGTIPEFSGMDKTPAGWSYGKLREDAWKHKGEKPLFTIDASNVDKYQDKLTPGQIRH